MKLDILSTLNLSRRQMVAASAAGVAALAFGNALAFADAAASADAQTTTDPTGTVDSEGYVLDMNGDQAVKAGTVKTVLTVNSVATEMVLLLGGEDAAATLGQGFQYSEGSLNAKMYPNLADKKTFTRDDCTVENVAAIGPDLVIIDVPETVQALREAGINAAAGSVTSPATIMSFLDLLAQAMGGDAIQKAESYRQEYEGVIAELTEAVEKAGVADEDKSTVLYLRGIDSCCGSETMPDNWITTTGGVNVAASLGLTGSRAEIGLEAIMDADPAIIVCESPSTYADVTGNDALTELSAIKNGTVYTAPLGPVVWSMGSTEALLMLYWAANIINPDLFSYDIESITKEYFTTFYGYELSDEELAEILDRQ